MQTNVLWTGREYHSLENCLISSTNSGSEITSAVIGVYEKKIYKIDYCIRVNENWETVFVEVKARHSDQTQLINFEGDGKGYWMCNGKEVIEFNGCIDIDIPLTPFTNTLPINRLKLIQNKTQEIQVIYIDILAGQIRKVRQRYTRLSNIEYHYENVPNDFEATIKVDELGLVVDYPTLFVRTACLETAYH